MHRSALLRMPRSVFCERSAEYHSATPSTTASMSLPSGPSGMFSMALFTSTPRSRRRLRYIAAS